MKKLTKEVILNTIEQNADVVRGLGVKKLILFGSYARDEQNENSDIDFLVEFEMKRGDYKDKLKLLHFLEDTFEKKIDLGQKNMLREDIKPYVIKGAKYEAKL
jgi:hypothetical protein